MTSAVRFTAEVFLYKFIQKVILYKKSAFSPKILKIQQYMVSWEK